MKDSFFGGALELLQPASGYRVNVDTLLLAEFVVKSSPRARAMVDLGSGVGALSLAVNHLGRVERADLVEVDAELAELAERNLVAAGLRGAVHRMNLNAGLPRALRASADVVVCNPPYFGPDASGAGSGAETRRRARSGPVEPFLDAARSAAGRRATAFFVYPAAALTEFFAAARKATWVPKRLRLVHANARSPARIALVELKRAKPGGLVVEPPLVEWASPGVRSPELLALTSARKT